MTTFFDLFSSGGGAAQGAKQAGLIGIGGVEWNRDIAAIYSANHGRIKPMNILTTDPDSMTPADWLHASPVCKNFSAAKTGRLETAWDIVCARKVAEYIRVWEPKYFSLENVPSYAKSKWSLPVILDALYGMGYLPKTATLNAADFGVPQSRRRFFLWAVRGEFAPDIVGREPHRGWYDAIADLLPGLPDTKLAKWQVARLPDDYQSLLVHPTDQRTHPMKFPCSPSFTVTASMGSQRPAALLIEKIGARSDRLLQTRTGDRPCWTIRALGHDRHWHQINALVNYRTVRLDIACLARLQSFPDDYQWSGKKSTDGTVIGNSVPPLLMEKVIRSVVG